MATKKDNIRFFVEGETEIALLKALGILGVKQKVNLWENDVQKILRKLKPNTTIYIVYDTDRITQYQRFLDNLKKLQYDKNITKIYLLQQTKNLEDELSTACSKSKAQLQKAFKAQDDKELKSRLCECSPENLLQKLNKLSLQTDKLWQGEQLPELLAWQKHRVNFTDLERI